MHVKLTIDQKNLLEAFLKQRRKRIVRNIKKKDTSDVEYAELTENERTEFTKYRKRKRRKFSKCFSTLLEKLKIEFVDKPELTNTDLVFLITLLKYGNNVPIHIFIKNLASETLHFNSFLSNTTVPGIYIPTTTTTTTTTIPMMKMDIKKEEEDADPLLQMTESEEISIRMNNPRLSTEELLVMEKQYQEALYRERIEDLAKQKILEEKDAYSLFIKEISQLQNSVFIESAIRLNQLGLINKKSNSYLKKKLK
jgi:hypothetical protein